MDECLNSNEPFRRINEENFIRFVEEQARAYNKHPNWFISVVHFRWTVNFAQQRANDESYVH